MINQKSGFTLMEIMVVIIIIAVLASVAGPMITGITDQGKASATKSALGNLKTALINYNADLGGYPHAGTNARAGANYGVSANDGSNGFVGNDSDQCCLTSSILSTTGWKNMGIAAATYNRRWKGPYMEGEPGDFLVDSWGNPIRYGTYKKVLFLQSGGPDGSYDDPTKIIGNNNYTSDGGDDILVQVSRARHTYGSTVHVGKPYGL